MLNSGVRAWISQVPDKSGRTARLLTCCVALSLASLPLATLACASTREPGDHERVVDLQPVVVLERFWRAATEGDTAQLARLLDADNSATPDSIVFIIAGRRTISEQPLQYRLTALQYADPSEARVTVSLFTDERGHQVTVDANYTITIVRKGSSWLVRFPPVP